METTPKMTVRKAREEDYEGVMNITDNYIMGADYLYFSYKELVNDPDSTYYVCEVNGEVAAFEGVCLLDDNNTLMTRSARVKDKFQGQGLLNLIRKQIFEDYKDVPGKKRIRTCCTNIVRLVHSSKFRELNRTLATRLLAVHGPNPVQKLQITFETKGTCIQELNSSDLGIIFQNKELVNYLFPDGFVEIISWFYEPLVSNLRHIEKQNPYIFITDPLKDKIKKLATNGDENPENLMIGSSNLAKGLLCISSYYVTPSMFYFKIDIYGQTSSEKEVKEIILCGLQFAFLLMEKQDIKLPITFSVSTNDSFTLDICKNVIASLGFERGKFEALESHFFFEQDFENLLG